MATDVIDVRAKVSVNTNEYEKGMKDAAKEAEKTTDENKKLGKATEEAGKDAKDSGSKFSDFGDKLKTVAGKAAELTATLIKVGSVAVTAASAAVVKVTKDAVESYGNYQQLVGGAKAIFDEMDYSKIATDAANAYKELNMSASEYIESINLAGATFAQTMGDEKGYETARKGMLAISDYASGTGKSIDELNQKYQMITRSSASYQSIADQFSGILPQTTSDFLSQAQAAGFLSTEYTKLTDVPVAEYQEAVTAMLEKGVADLGLSQNAMRESTETLTGSIAMTKSAWQNLVTGLADPDADLGTLIDNFVGSASSMLENIIPTIERALEGVGTLIEKIAPKIAEELPKLVENTLPSLLNAALALVEGLGNALIENGPQLIEAGLTLLESLLSALTNIGNDPQSERKFREFIEGIKTSIMKHLPNLLKMAIDLTIKIAMGIIENLPMIIQTFLDFLTENFEQIVSSLTEMLPILIQALIDIILQLAEWLTDNMDMIIDSIVQIITAIAETLTDPDNISKLIQAAVQIISALTVELLAHLPEILALGGEIIVNLFQGIWDALTELTSPISEWLSDTMIEIGEWIDEAIAAVTGFFVSIGNTISGWGESIGKWFSEKIDAIANFGKDIWESLKESLSGNNPIADWLADCWMSITETVSGWWDSVKQWGSDLIENFIQGIKDGWDWLTDAVGDTAGIIADFLHFSEPEKGPLSDFHSYSPDMIDLFVKGIQDNEDKVATTLNETFGMETMNETGTEAVVKSGASTMSMLERILAAIEQGKVIALDGDKLVGATASRMDSSLGEQTKFNERGLAYV